MVDDAKVEAAADATVAEATPAVEEKEKAAPKAKAPRAKKEKPAKKEAEVEGEGEGEAPKSIFDTTEVLRTERRRSAPQRLEATSTATPKKEVTIPNGKGTAFADIPNIKQFIERHTSKDLKLYHTFLFGAHGRELQFKDHLRKFKGFDFKDDADRKKKSASLESKSLNDLKKFATFLDVERSGTKEELSQRILGFLENPKSSGRKPATTPKKSPAKKAKSPKGKAKKASKKASKEDGAPKRPTTAFMCFAADRRPALRQEDPSAGVTDIARKTVEEWGKLTEDQKKKYAEIAALDKVRYEREMEDWKKSGGAAAAKKSPKKKAAPKKAAAKKSSPKKATKKSTAAVSSSDDSSDDSASSEDSSDEEEEKPKPKPKAKSPAKAAKRKAADSDDDDAPLAKKAKGGPSDDEVKAAIADIVASANLDQLTKRMVKDKLSAKFPEFDTVAKKDQLNDWINAAVSS
eukprot:Opistho-2@77052